MKGRARGCVRLRGPRRVRGLSVWLLVWRLIACGLLTGTAARAQMRARPMAYPGVDGDGLATTLPAALRTMATQAGVIFVGTVTGVRRVEGDGFAAVGVVEVQFAVEQAIRGIGGDVTGGGASYMLREWGGLFPPGERGFALGDRRLMLLHSPGATGLSSPVGGFEGAIPIVGAGARVGRASRGMAVAEPMLDLRWVAARLAHPVVYAVTGGETGREGGGVAGRAEMVEERSQGEAGRGTEQTAEAEGRAPTLVHGTLGGLETRRAPGVASAAGAGGAASELPVASVVALLREWTEK